MQAHVHLVADHDGEGRRAEQSLRLDVPLGPGQQGVAGGAPARDRLAMVAPVTKPPPVPAGQAEHVDQPAEGDLLERGRRQATSPRV